MVKEHDRDLRRFFGRRMRCDLNNTYCVDNAVLDLRDACINTIF